MQAWSRADILGNQSRFMNALMTCLEEEEEKVTSFTLFNLHRCKLKRVNDDQSSFIARMILILLSLIETNVK
jgi:hypothetical protein